jgi:hypothetical protein
MNNIEWRRSTYCSTGACVEVAWVRSSYCSSGTCVEVAHDAGRGLILVRDSKNPKSPPLEWSTDMWESSVLARMIEGQLPAMARQDGEAEPAGLLVSRWAGGAVAWGHLRFDADEWTAFTNGVDAGEYDLPRLTR